MAGDESARARPPERPDLRRYRDLPVVGSVPEVMTRRLGEGTGLLWTAMVGMVALEHLLVATSGGTSPWWWTALAIAAATTAVALRRERPLAALAVIGTLVGGRILWSTGHGAPFPVSYIALLMAMSWLAGRRTNGTKGFALLVVGVNLTLLVLGITVRGDIAVAEVGLSWLLTLLSSLVVVVLPWLMGRHRQQRALLASAGWERAERMEHEQQLLVEQVRLRERTLIARDMHDSLGHELSLIALRAGALEVSPDLAERHQRAAGELREAAATATDRLSQIVGVLREEGAQAPLTPSGEGVAELVERVADSGMRVTLVTDGELAAAPDPVRRAVHRVVREGLTNATKHAVGAPVTVRVSTTDGQSTVSVTNARVGASPFDDEPHGGLGLVGLAELADLLGGTLRSGVTEGGGFEIVADLPHEVGSGAARTDSAEGTIISSAHEQANARRGVRRTLVVAAVAPLVMGVSVCLLILGYYVGISYASILDPGDYRDLRVGDARTSVDQVLPPLEMVDPPVGRGDAPPPGSRCEYYRPDRPFSISFAYRLCFADGTLMSKDVIQTGSVTPDEENP